MKSIFQYKQYDMISDDSGYIPPTQLKREINGISWIIYPNVNHGEAFHKRDFDLSLIDGNIDTDNYRFVHYCKNKIYQYRNGEAYTTKKRRIVKDLVTKEAIGFDDFCNIIKKNEKYIST